MSYVYTSLEPGGQVIRSPEPIDYLEGIARWVRTEEPDEDKPAPSGAPRRRLRPRSLPEADEPETAVVEGETAQ